MLTFERLQNINLARAEIWHTGSVRPWSLLEWAGAMCGEAGEAANICKKMLRIETGTPGNETSDTPLVLTDIRGMLAHEIADTIIYASLLASYSGIDLEDAVRERFNEKSKSLVASGALALPKWVEL